MKKQQTKFYATRLDLEGWLKPVEEQARLKYYRAGLFELAEDIVEYGSFTRIRDFGEALSGQDILQDKYLIMPEDEKLRLRNMPQRRSSKAFFSVAQEDNRNSVMLFPGGIFRGTQQAVMAGALENIWKTETALGLYDLFLKQMLKTFTAVRGWRVGPEALRLARLKYRLTTNLRSPKEQDLVP